MLNSYSTTKHPSRGQAVVLMLSLTRSTIRRTTSSDTSRRKGRSSRRSTCAQITKQEVAMLWPPKDGRTFFSFKSFLLFPSFYKWLHFFHLLYKNQIAIH